MCDCSAKYQKYLDEAKNGKNISAKGWAVENKSAKFKPFDFQRHPLGDNDVLLQILYAGICHSDIHSARSEWRDGIYPMVPGHEICSKVIAVGKNVSKFQIGDIAGIGCLVNSCGECDACRQSLEQFCEKAVFTYDSVDVFHNNTPAYGGYSDNIVVSERFAIKVPKNADLTKVAPLLCAGITTYSPLKFSHCDDNSNGKKSVAIAGFGGLGVMAVKYALAFGAEVSVFARNENKKAEALKLGVKNFYTTNDAKQVKERFDVILSTIPTKYSVKNYLELLKFGGEMGIVGLPPTSDNVGISVSELVFTQHRKIYGSLIGGIAQTQEMLDFSVANNIYPEIEMIKPTQIDEAYDKLTSGQGKFRFVIDVANNI